MFLLVGDQCVTMNLHLIVVLHVLAEHPPWRVIELVVFDLMAGKGVVEGCIDKRVEGCVFHLRTPLGGSVYGAVCSIWLLVGWKQRVQSSGVCGIFYGYRETTCKMLWKLGGKRKEAGRLDVTN